MTVTKSGPPSTPAPDDPGEAHHRWVYILALVLVALAAVAAVIEWPIYGAAATVVVAVAIAIVHICRS